MKQMDNLDIIGTSLKLDNRAISDILNDSLIKLEADKNQKIEIKFVDKDEMQKLNKKHRGVDEPTDVISFPLEKIPGDKSVLGSIVICEEYMEKIGGKTKELIKHGLLHLLGNDHERDQKEWDKIAKRINHTML